MFRYALTALAVLFAFPVVAQQQPCAPAGAVYDKLANDYGERLAFAGDHQTGNQVQLWVNDTTGSWTIIIARPDGIACVASAGEGMAYIPAGFAL